MMWPLFIILSELAAMASGHICCVPSQWEASGRLLSGNTDSNGGLPYRGFVRYFYFFFCMIPFRLRVISFDVLQRGTAFMTSRPRGYKTFPCSTQLSMELFLLINVKMPTIVGILTFMSRKNSIINLSEPKRSRLS